MTTESNVPELDYADFAKITLKAGKVLSVRKLDSDLFLFCVDVGEGPFRTIVQVVEGASVESFAGQDVVVLSAKRKGVLEHRVLISGNHRPVLFDCPVAPGTLIR